MVSQNHHHRLVAEVLNESYLFGLINRQAFEIMVSNSVMQQGRVKIIRTQTAFLARDSHARSGVRVRNTGYVVSCGVYTAVNQHSCWIHEMFGFFNDVSFDIDFDQI